MRIYQGNFYEFLPKEEPVAGIGLARVFGESQPRSDRPSLIAQADQDNWSFHLHNCSAANRIWTSQVCKGHGLATPGQQAATSYFADNVPAYITAWA
jgi:hypothetical protein